MRSWKEYHHLTIDEEATETWTSHDVLLHCATGGVGVGLPGGEVDPPREGALPHAEKGIGARVHDAIEAGHETDDTDPALNPQVTTVVTDIGATQSLLKGLRKATRRAGEEMSNGFILTFVQMAPSGYEKNMFSERIKISSSGSYAYFGFFKKSSRLVGFCSVFILILQRC